MVKLHFLIVVLFLVACEKEEEISGPSIVNPWMFDSSSLKNYDDSALNIEESSLCTDTNCFKYFFAEDGTFTYEIKISGIIDTQTGTYTVSGDNLTICIAACSIPVTYVVSGTTLTLAWTDAANGCKGTRVYNS